MKKIKKILLVAVAATMLASTTAFAAETATTATEATANAGKTYGDQFKEVLSQYGVPASMQADVITILDTFTLSDKQVQQVTNQIKTALSYLDGCNTTAEMKAAVNKNQQAFLDVKDNIQTIIPGLVITPNMADYSVKITSKDADLNTVVLADWDRATLSAVGKNDALLAAIKDEATVDAIVASAAAVSQNKSTTIDPSTVTPGDVDDDPTVDPDGDYTEEEKAFLEKWNAKAEEYEAVKATYNADKTLTNALAVRDKLREFKELLDTCPESLKAELQAKYDACAAEVDAILAAFGSNERVDANKSGTSTFAPSNKGTLAKTATNNGNMAVAGLAMIAVAGTVFVVSKKKIAE